VVDEITDAAVGVLRSGVDNVCDHAVSKWFGDSYGLGPEKSYEHIQRWEKIRRRAKELVKETNDSLKKE
jgi:hypothetical protein